MQQPKVSVIVPSFNYGRYLPGTITGILSQSYGDLELVVTDDCSTDESRDVLDQFRRLDKRVKVLLHKANSGVATARNSALAASSGEFIALCDADDLWIADKLKIQMQGFEKNPGLDVAHSDTSIIDGDGHQTDQRFSSLMHRRGQITSGNLFDELCQRNFICISTVVMRRPAMLFAKGFETLLPPLEDWVCWTLISQKYTFAYTDQPLAAYRVHGGSLSHNPRRMASSRVKAIAFLLQALPNLSPQARSGMLYSLGMSHLELNEPQRAAQQFLKSVQLTPGKLRSWARCCQAFANQAAAPKV